MKNDTHFLKKMLKVKLCKYPEDIYTDLFRDLKVSDIGHWTSYLLSNVSHLTPSSFLNEL